MTHEQLLTLTSQIHQNSKAELEVLLHESEAQGKGDLLKEAWKQDVKERAEFNKDQTKSG